MEAEILEVKDDEDLLDKARHLRKWILDFMPSEVLLAEFNKRGRPLDFDEAAREWVAWLSSQKSSADEWTTEKQEKINELRLFIQDTLTELPLELFERGKKVLGLGPQEGPARPFTADDSFRDAMSHASESIPSSNPTERAGLYIAMMDAIARKQHAEATERGLALGKKSFEILEALKEG